MLHLKPMLFAISTTKNWFAAIFWSTFHHSPFYVVPFHTNNCTVTNPSVAGPKRADHWDANSTAGGRKKHHPPKEPRSHGSMPHSFLQQVVLQLACCFRMGKWQWEPRSNKDVFFPQQQNAMGSLHNIDFGVCWASWGGSGKKRVPGKFREGSGKVPGTVPGTG